MKIVLMAIALLGLSACGSIDRGMAKFTGYSKICVDNVQYIQFTSGATVQYDKLGKIVPCQ